jgi:hypothetical protein
MKGKKLKRIGRHLKDPFHLIVEKDMTTPEWGRVKPGMSTSIIEFQRMYSIGNGMVIGWRLTVNTSAPGKNGFTLFTCEYRPNECVSIYPAGRESRPALQRDVEAFVLDMEASLNIKLTPLEGTPDFVIGVLRLHVFCKNIIGVWPRLSVQTGSAPERDVKR